MLALHRIRVFLLMAGCLLAQHRVPVRVSDVTGAAISGALVSAGGTQAEVTAPGLYTLTLAPGEHTLMVAKEGFSEVRRAILAPLASEGSVDIVLQVGPSQEAITVREGALYLAPQTNSATRTPAALRDIPQSITVVTQELMRDQLMMSVGDVVRYVPGITAHQGENNRDQVVIRGNNSSADFFVDGIRDDAQYFRDLYNLESIEALKGPNAMIFGRGGGGGVVNRATKKAEFAPIRELMLQGGSFGNKRAATDFDRPLGEKAAVRLNGMFEDSASFRDGVELRRWGVNPAVALRPWQSTGVHLSFEHLTDHRTADRGIPSFQGRPAGVPRTAFFGNPDDSRVTAGVNLGSVAVERQFGRVNLRNRSLFGHYDRFYRNYVPGAVSAGQVAISAYDTVTQRLNVFNQTDVSSVASTGRVRHTLLGGAELGRQATDNFRNTGFFNGSAASIQAPLRAAEIRTPIVFRQGATDADNRVTARVGAAYVQDQMELSRYLQVIAGLRFDHFDLRFHNNRDGGNLRRIDRLVSPRAGLVLKPAAGVSVYGSYSVSYLPSSGDQFSSLTSVTQQMKPERFQNYEVGAKWDMARSLSLTAALYRLDRTNTRSVDPNNPTRIVQTGEQRSQGFEIGTNGSVTRRWSIAGGYAFQNARVTSATAAARKGAWVDQSPRHSFSFWNHYQAHRRLGFGAGILNRTDMFAAIDNAVTLPGYTRVDAAVFVPLGERVRLQANVENVLGSKYFLNAHNNTNISPGSPRAVRVGMVARF